MHRRGRALRDGEVDSRQGDRDRARGISGALRRGEKGARGFAPFEQGPLAPSRVRFEEGIYSREVTQATYEALRGRAEELLNAGATVILDATFSKREQREAVQNVVRETGSRLVHFECQAPPEVAARRMTERARHDHDASDAGPEIQAAQRAMYDPTRDAVLLDTAMLPEEVLGGGP